MNEKILLCDDEVHIVNASKFKFQRAGYEVFVASDGEEAWPIIEAEMPDLVVTDCQMPRLDGLGLAARMRDHEHTANIPVIMLTAKGLELSSAETCAKYGIAKIIHKPFSPRDLLRRVDELLEARSQTRRDTEVLDETVQAVINENALRKLAGVAED